MKKETLEKMIGQLQDAVKEKDNEKAHSIYDTIAFVLARLHEPKTMNKMDKIVKNMEFWCA